MSVDVYEIGTIEEDKLDYAVICSMYIDKSLYVKHKERKTWEIPGGRREKGELIAETGKRELIEETGAKQFTIYTMCDYSVTREGKTSYGRLFYSEIQKLSKLPNLEIEELELFDDIPVNLTYPAIQPLLHKKIVELKRKGMVAVMGSESVHIL